MSDLMITLSNDNHVQMLSYSKKVENLSASSLFEHSLWETFEKNEYGLLVTLDKDASIIQHHIINQNTDMMYLVMNLPQHFTMKKGEILEISLIPSAGTIKSVTLTAPLPITSVVSFL